MTISELDLVREWGRSVVHGSAALFVGAGLSQASGLPGWEQLIADLRAEANVPAKLQDLPLVAEYVSQDLPGGSDRMRAHILQAIVGANPTPSAGHRSLASLAVDELWTTNYDWLIEEADTKGLAVVARDEDLQERLVPGRRRLTKMHGSISADHEWQSDPVITRQDFERYERTHPRTWAALQATFLTKSILFLGFSFSDPNIELLLKLSRSFDQGATPLHFTVLTVPTEADDARLHDLRKRDLEASGIRVCEISAHNQLSGLLAQLVRRTQPPRLFVSGSRAADDTDLSRIAKSIGHQLAQLPAVTMASLAGLAGLETSFAFANDLESQGKYDPARVLFYFRARNQQPAPPIPQRTGTAIYTGLEREPLRRSVLSECRAMVVLGGGEKTRAEVSQAVELQVPVVPVAATGGAARSTWESVSPTDLHLFLEEPEALAREWTNLASTDEHIAAAAATRLIRAAMYLDSDHDLT